MLYTSEICRILRRRDSREVTQQPQEQPGGKSRWQFAWIGDPYPARLEFVDCVTTQSHPTRKMPPDSLISSRRPPSRLDTFDEDEFLFPTPSTGGLYRESIAMSRAWLITVVLCCLSIPSWAADDATVVDAATDAVDGALSPPQLSPAQLRAADEARQRQARIANRHRSGGSSGRLSSWRREDLLQNPFIYRIDYGMTRRTVVVPFRIHRDSP